MRLLFRFLALAALPLLLQGCIARTALDLVTLPVTIASEVVDKATTSQAEADQKRGREIREEEERLGREAKKREAAEKKRREAAAREERERDD